MAQDARVQEFVKSFQSLHSEVQKVIVGHDDVILSVLVGLFAGGHVLLEGAPGLGKTLLVRTLAEGLELSFSRIQFTPTSSSRTRAAASGSSSRRDRSSATSCSPTR